MEVFEAYPGMYEYKYLPAYAQFLLSNHLHDYATEQLALSRKLNLPILKSLTERFSEDEILQIATSSSREYLQYITANKGKEQIMSAMTKWLQDQLTILGQSEISAKDITLLNYIRGQALKKFLLAFTNDVTHLLSINAEIDLLLLGSATTSADIFIDILRGKIAEQSNLASKLIEASPAITFLYDTVNNRQVFISGKVYEVLGYSTEELMQMNAGIFLQLIHPRDLEMMIEHIRKLMDENRNDTSQVEFRFKHKDGNYRWLRSYEVIFSRDASEKPQYVLGKTFEVTKEKETAIALKKRETQLLEAQALAHIGNYEWNIKEERSNSSEEVYRIFEIESAQPYNEFMTHVHPDDVQRVRDAIAQSFITGRYECEYRYVKNEKEKVIWSVGKVEFRNDEPYRIVGTVQDVTEIKKIERQLLQKSDELAQSNESLRQFAFVASHDMKEPLRKIMMFSEMVLNNRENKLTENSVVQLQKMQTAGKNLYRMVEDILSFSVLGIKEEKEEVDLNEIVGDVAEMLEETIKEKGAKVIWDGLPTAFVIASQFRQLFQNLISNSLKFQRKDVPPVINISGQITRSPSINPAVPADKYLVVTITDNGIGFPREMNEKIFELFGRLHSKSEYEGTGLGLSISRRIVDNHDGFIAARSESGKGATFTVVIPQ